MGRKPITRGPQFVSYFGPVVQALKNLGGSARPAEVREEIVAKLAISESTQAETTSNGMPRFDNQVAWARFYLAKAGVIDSSSRGLWALTEKGRALTRVSHEEAMEMFKSVSAQFRVDRSAAETRKDEEDEAACPADRTCRQ